MKITPFGVAQWQNEFASRCDYNLSESCVASLTLGELLDLGKATDSILEKLRPLALTYGAVEGSDRLRAAIAGLYTSRTAADVLVAHGATGANALLYQALISPGDRVVTLVPNYQQHYSIPESLGAEVRRLELQPWDGYLPDLTELRRQVIPGTKLIVFSNPNNPTGSLMHRSLLEEVTLIAARVGAYVLGDEVFRGTTQAEDELTPSVADLYERGISTGSMSKAFALTGLRLGWICGPPEVLRAAMIHRDYNTISVGMIDDLLSCIALENREKVLNRSGSIVRQNLAILDRWLNSEERLSYVKPKAGTIALIHYHFDIPSREFCARLLDEARVLVVPGEAFEQERCFRIHYGNHQAMLEKGLQRTSSFLRKLAADVATAT